MGTKIEDLPVPQKGNVDYALKPESAVKKAVRFENTPASENPSSPNDARNTMPAKELSKETLLTEINEENLLLIGILYLSTLPTLDAFITKVPGTNMSPFFVTLIKCALLVALFVVLKRHILPKIKL